MMNYLGRRVDGRTEVEVPWRHYSIMIDACLSVGLFDPLTARVPICWFSRKANSLDASGCGFVRGFRGTEGTP